MAYGLKGFFIIIAFYKETCMVTRDCINLAVWNTVCLQDFLYALYNSCVQIL